MILFRFSQMKIPTERLNLGVDVDKEDDKSLSYS
jgi:hypothetical protein